ncbi:hypothetical protein [Marinobacterium aestuariivivens]|uniref:Uncharacterized protein n=1 Tax=Marinobacterium aestuariivivens TaxID=1698799 RepID=A0ABW1ZY09_9GAMM
MRTAAPIAALVALTLGGCAQLERPTEDYYTLDSRYLLMCRGTTNHCQELSLVASGINRVDPIEDAYGQQVRGPNYPLSLARMLLKPADGSYSPKPLDDSNRYYILPVNSKTDTVWDTLDDIHSWIYED